MTATVLIALTSPLRRRGLLDLLTEMPGLAVVAQSLNDSDTIDRLRGTNPDILVVDPVIWHELQSWRSELGAIPRTLVLGRNLHIGNCLSPGMNAACGFAGDGASEGLVREILQTLAVCRQSRANGHCGQCPALKTLRPPDLGLSVREQQVFDRIGRGEGVTTIAATLRVSVKTVESFRESIKRKLGLSTAHELVRAAVEWEAGEFVPRRPRSR